MFQICELPLGKGVLGISPLPGRGGTYDADLIALFQWNPSLVLSMTTKQEMEQKGAGDLGTDLSAAGVAWSHLPVPDFGAPPEETAKRWQKCALNAHHIIAKGGRVLAHCHGGCGRSGMALLRLMAEAGEEPKTALARLRVVRPCAVETDAQFNWAAAGFEHG